MINQVNLLFGYVPDTLEDFVLGSQLVQAEAMKYFVEKWRGGKFVEKNGLIWWNVKDGWPIISDAVVDYYFGKKLAYYFIRNVQRDVCAMMLDEDSTGLYPLVIINDTREEVSGKVTITDIGSGKKVWSGKYRTEANGRTLLTHIGKKADKGMYLIEYSVGEDNFKNHYLYGEKPFDLRKVTGWLESIGIYNEAECLGSSQGR
jgi:beta-mannosidase